MREEKVLYIYEVPCRDCECVYVNETGRTLKKWILEHKSAVRRLDHNNGIVAHLAEGALYTDWDQAKVVGSEEQYWRRVAKTVHIKSRPQTITLDCGLNLSHWQAYLKLPS